MAETTTTTDKTNITANISSLIRRRMRFNDPIRQQALEAFEQLGMPTPRSEEYKHTPISRELEKNFTFQETATAPVITDVSEYLIPGLEANVLVFLNGVFMPDLSRIISPTSQLEIGDLREALDKNDPVAVAHYNHHVQGSNDPLVAWNTADWQAGMFIRIPDKTVVEKPMVFYHINDVSSSEVTVSVRNLMVAGKSSQVTVIEKFGSSGPGNHFTNLVNEVVVEENARLDYYHLQTDRGGNRFQFTQTEIYQKDSSRVNAFTYDLHGRVLRTNLHLIIDGQGIESHMYGLYLVKGNTISDNHTVVDHRQPNSMTNELYKGILDDSSRGVFNGKIFVRPHAQKTNAFQANRNILLSEKATINTKPQLEIWADDVKCSHGCTSGQLDEEALFYLRARGIDLVSARAMMLYAFAAETFDKIPDDNIRAYVDRAVSERLQNNS